MVNSNWAGSLTIQKGSHPGRFARGLLAVAAGLRFSFFLVLFCSHRKRIWHREIPDVRDVTRIRSFTGSGRLFPSTMHVVSRDSSHQGSASYAISSVMCAMGLTVWSLGGPCEGRRCVRGQASRRHAGRMPASAIATSVPLFRCARDFALSVHVLDP
jgi:hypothetical protein